MTKQSRRKYIGFGAIIGTSALVTGAHLIRKKVRGHRDRQYIKQFISHYVGHNQYLMDTVDDLTCDQAKQMHQLIYDVMNRTEQVKSVGSKIDQNIHHIIDRIEACVKSDGKDVKSK